MVYLTKAQRKELKRLWDERVSPDSFYIRGKRLHIRPPGLGISYKEFRKTVSGLIGGGGCVMVKVKGLWYGIETDGYRHT